MCLAITCQGGARPRESTLETAARTNRDGGGVAWVEHHDEPVIKFEKGLDVEGVKQLSETVPHPYIVHFRAASAGGDTDNLSHPFPISPMAEDVMSADELDYPLKRVLFQNGTAKKWKKRYQTFIASRPVTHIPPHGTENLSDTRALAYMVYHMSQNAKGQDPRIMAENILQAFAPKSRFAILDAEAAREESDQPTLRYLGKWWYCRKLDNDEEANILYEEDGNRYEGGLLFSNRSWRTTAKTT